ncbi:IS1/IS1595 family N-terminal zinc-binding domain-containing protein [Pleurocapsa sp. FMAR1]|uniref:IS1/IS1595 family N-terminal zinc-binding domain-containing protein n=1 Tax=Pleurocapsa sp. FMAR1 TaxID=3040204 RepID=UPI0029C924E9|nr:IS1 family transposase [Pleurocapsa sp. FMAR1]
MLISCPSCKSKQIVKNGKIHNGNQNYRCRDCGRQFVENRQQKVISQPTKNLIDKLLLEKIPLAGIARHCVGKAAFLCEYSYKKRAIGFTDLKQVSRVQE